MSLRDETEALDGTIRHSYREKKQMEEEPEIQLSTRCFVGHEAWKPEAWARPGNQEDPGRGLVSSHGSGALVPGLALASFKDFPRR